MTDTRGDERDVELIDYLHVIWRRRRLVVAGTLAGVLLAGLVSWIMPRTYRVVTTIDTADLTEERAKDVERLVARVNTAGALETGPGAEVRRVPVTAEFRKPFMVELRADTPAPADAVTALGQTAARVVEELNRLLRFQQDEHNAKVATLQAQIEVARSEAEGMLAQLRVDLGRRIRATRGDLELARVGTARLRQRRTLLQQRLADARRTVDQLRAVRAEALRGAETATAVLLASQLSTEIVAKETAIQQLEWETAELPEELGRAENSERTLNDQLAVLGTARKALEDHAAPASPKALEVVREAVYRMVAPSTPEGTYMETALRKLGAELPEKLRTLERQVDDLGRKAAAVRPARIVSAPAPPNAPVRPHVKLNLAVGFAAGLLGSVVLALFVDYLRQAGPRRERTG
jgi:hypothetical protein